MVERVAWKPSTVPAKQVIVVRRDLNMPPGKLAAQVAHASIAFLTRRLKPKNHYNPCDTTCYLSQAEYDWCFEQGFTKVVLGVDSEEELEAIAKAAESGFEVHRIVDEGRTTFDGVPTFTCVGIGPNYNTLMDKVTGHLRLY